jgi:ABC-type nitrate/sulfonate/bicarbonate transport system permease component
MVSQRRASVRAGPAIRSHVGDIAVGGMILLSRLRWYAGSILVGAALVGVWQLVADIGDIPPVFLPGPDKSWAALVAGFSNGELRQFTAATVERMFYGWVLASLAGILLGALIGSSRLAREYVAPSLELIRPIPVSAYVPIVISFVGLTGDMVLVVVVIGSVWPVLLATVHGVMAVEPRLVELSRSLRMGRIDTLRKITLPNALPDILAGARIGLTVALILAVVGEILTSEEGLGYHVLISARAFRSADMFAGIILLGLLGFVSNVALQAAEYRLLRWRRR